MATSKRKPIKVDKKIKPIHFQLRKEPVLNIGELYYVSFGSNEAIRCRLIDILDHGENQGKNITIEITNCSKGFFNGTNTLFSDEIGLTPEEAVINTVTS